MSIWLERLELLDEDGELLDDPPLLEDGELLDDPLLPEDGELLDDDDIPGSALLSLYIAVDAPPEDDVSRSRHPVKVTV